jgi:WD40-like Beta Propeller Repeat
MLSIARVIATALAVALIGTSAPPHASAAAPGANGRIAFTRDDAIWSVASNGTDEQQLTAPIGDDRDFAPAWSPGGTMIAYTHSTGGFATDVWVMSADGSNERLRIGGSATESNPAWSPDAAWVAFTSDRNAVQRTMTGEFFVDIWAHGSSLVRVTHEEPHRRHAAGAAWSPDNDLIAMGVVGESGSGIAVEEAGSVPGRVSVVAEHEGGGNGTDWSPDAAQIVYHVVNGCCDGDIWTVAPGAAPEPIITGPTADLDPAYSPDGTRIVFARDGVLHTADADGSNVASLGVEGGEPAWQPIPDEPLVDARFSTLGEHVTWARENGITSGCAPERFCPDRTLTRGEAASFISRALNLPPPVADHFTDDTGSTHEDEANQLQEAGISSGCGAARFCPNHPMNREMMAAWLDRALDPDGTTEDFFVDDESSRFEDSINRLAAAGIVSGCATDRFCPGRDLTRVQAVALLHRALD